MTSLGSLRDLRDIVRELYRVHAAKVPYHGWHHVNFVAQKSEAFVHDLGADETLTVAAAYVHDLNYLVAGGGGDENLGKDLRIEMLTRSGFSDVSITRVESIIAEARTAHRHATISPEAKALSDADTAYKALPITPLMSVSYMKETGRSLRELAQKIVSEQTPLKNQGIYFYSDHAQAIYGADADINLQLWSRVLDSLDNVDVATILEEMSG